MTKVRPATRVSCGEALRYIGRTSEVAWSIVLAATIGVFGLNMPVILAAFADHVFTHRRPRLQPVQLPDRHRRTHRRHPVGPPAKPCRGSGCSPAPWSVSAGW